MSPWSKGVSKIIGETQLSLRECGFAHLFEKEGFIDAPPQLPQGVARIEEQERPLLERAANEGAGGAGLFATLEAKMLEATTVRSPLLLNAA